MIKRNLNRFEGIMEADDEFNELDVVIDLTKSHLKQLKKHRINFDFSNYN